MGYTTDFAGQFKCDPPLDPVHVAYLQRFRGTRRMQRNPDMLPEDPLREAADLPPGTDGEYFVGDGANFGQNKDDSIINFNSPPRTQPGLWCQWVPTDDGKAIEWDGGEKFYSYVEWLEYIIEAFMVPWGYVLNGEVGWQGEEHDDCGVIYCEDNKVDAVENEHYNPGPEGALTDEDHKRIAYALNFLAMNLDESDVQQLTGVEPDSEHFAGATMELEEDLLKLSARMKIVPGG